MDNPWDTMRAALQQADATQRAVDDNARKMAQMLVGRLRKVDVYTLKALKHELQKFDAVTRKWKS